MTGRHRRRTAILLALIPFAACSGPDVSTGIEATPLATRNASDGPRFRRLDPEQSGLRFQNELSRAHTMPYLYNGGGCAAGDYDSDGLCDIYLVNQDGSNKLFRQTTPLQFEDVTAAAGVGGGNAWGSGCSFIDIDGDGDLDLYVCNTEAPNLLYINLGDGTFVDRAAEFGLAHTGASTMPAFADYDNDGDVDLYLVTNRVLSPTMPRILLREITPPADTQRSVADMAPTTAHLLKRKSEGVDLFKDFYFKMAEGRIYAAGQRDRLFRNDGTGHFHDVTDTSGIDDQAMGLSATWWDYDDDGWLDLYVANDLESPDLLYHNRGDGTFEEVSKQALPQTAYFGMGSDAADIDNDGRFDLIVADMSSTTHYKSKMIMGEMDKRRWFLINSRPPQIMRNALFLNTGTDRFMEIGRLAGVASTDWTWATKFGDLDCDGFVDLFVTNGIPRFDNNPDINPRFRSLLEQGKEEEAFNLARNLPSVKERNLVFKNNGALHFDDVSAAWGLDHEGVSHGAVYCDLDRDGDLDIIVNNLNEPAAVYENTTHDSHRVLIRLVGTKSNSYGLGTRVTLFDGEQLQSRILSLSHGYLSADDPLLHFGLGDRTEIVRLTVAWPSGRVQEFTHLAADQFYTITEPKAATPAISTPTVSSRRSVPAGSQPALPVPLFSYQNNEYGRSHRHRETPFDDYAHQPLLPQKHSQLGPGLAFGDANGDGLEDCFVGGASGQNGSLWLARPNQTFERIGGPWENNTYCEDMGMVWFDLEGDGDLDLYVVSGSVEQQAGHATLRDRLYLNDGKGGFVKSDAHPQIADSGSCVCAADFDRDGDLDLFVGGRIVPGRYPEAPPSRLLRNDNGVLVGASAEIAPGLANSGLVTSALWTDVDDDGWLDLMVTAHWSPVRLWRNHGGKLVEDTEAAGLTPYTGWWNGIACGDLDRDGDLDYVVTNLGKNTKYKASQEHPAQIFYADFDDNGVLDIIEAKFEGDILLPVRGRSCSTDAIPSLAPLFPTFHEFALATLEDIYSPAALANATNKKATTSATSILINDGKGHFEIRALPHLAQVAPSFGVTVQDFDANGHLDIVLAQNFYQPEPETGRMAGGLSMFLQNQGDLTFAVMRPIKSGIVVPEAATAAATADFNRDGVSDLVIATNDGPLRAYITQTNELASCRSIRLINRGANRTGVGARITVETQDGAKFVREIHAGGGYLSQSTSLTFFSHQKAVEVSVRWPDGATTEHRSEDRQIVITR